MAKRNKRKRESAPGCTLAAQGALDTFCSTGAGAGAVLIVVIQERENSRGRIERRCTRVLGIGLRDLIPVISLVPLCFSHS